ncbi:hypothetical protein PYW07_004227 [Mythimna separata]|uniref:Uncharacterized protein n=1 Tax=Mythimna separata TaxID=271217 RepID=A0AAD7Y796_MYTSE|nr:hypothetical protein PYW07_013150 [Mythimna separata]KAJ8705143.1 hypothetical protein PYW07_010970 [Mythimna separata]KAJ8722365.1 hypothetical protein PYW07_003545 [Mythimna separata]KAJ8723591.1 hypothetical protein PYW07_007571 [Mythimna separata]KAJ8731063.1 hypothetical protein PYW07_004227 [Mythimna separata]
MAALTLKRAPDYDKCPVSFVKGQIRRGSLDEWNRRYRSGVTAGTTKVFFPDAIEGYHIVRKIPLDSIITQMLTGHGGFSEYLVKFKCKEDPSCACAPGVDESALHILLDCPIFGRARYDSEQEIGQKITKNTVQEIMRNNKKRTKFLEYTRKIAEVVIKKNK